MQSQHLLRKPKQSRDYMAAFETEQDILDLEIERDILIRMSVLVHFFSKIILQHNSYRKRNNKYVLTFITVGG
ncbi:hypothetical protein [Gracilibacillus oryzae]|uniref:hypothetical protein n=1 Tax=Gracilibacillus oryzae TaxID=1672701 RepID=UPI001294E9A3|nr:hypothetical protein [Gracilibacillus oryzae]